MTKNLRFKILSIIFLFFLFSSLGQTIFAQDCNPEEKPSGGTNDEVVSTDYKCSSASCGSDILKREEIETTITTYNGCVCDETKGEWRDCQKETDSDTEFEESTIVETCKNWESCSGDTDWSSERGACECDKECLETPGEIKYYDNVQNSSSSSSVSLPIRLNWNDVDGAASYEVKINGQNYTASQSEYFQSCVFNIGSSNSLEVSACCGSSGTNCSDSPSLLPFTTNKKIELISPEDPDWAGEGSATISDWPVILKWCPVDNKIDNKTIHSYRYNIYREDEWIFEYQTFETQYEDFYQDKENILFTINTPFSWNVAYCFDEKTTSCEGYSDKWRIIVDTDLDKPTIPDDNELLYVNFYDKLSWNPVNGAGSYIISLKNKNGTDIAEIKSFEAPTEINKILYELSLETIWEDYLTANTEYQWQVMPCPDENAECVINTDSQGDIWEFKTTGEAPVNINVDATIIPVILDWEDVNGAFAYRYLVYDNLEFEGIPVQFSTSQSKVSLDYPQIKPNTTYNFQVKTCADEGTFCGPYSGPIEFTTFVLNPPLISSPANGEALLTSNKTISWELVPGAKAYIYSASYLSNSGEDDENCAELVGKEIISGEIISYDSDWIDLLCLGQYSLQIQSCVDPDCIERSDTESFSFTLNQPSIDSGGLVPCGRYADDPNTPWNEREKCGIKHLFFLF